jgi:uncharacterized FAD-dependent dehydrogenase
MHNLPFKEIELRLHTDFSGDDIRKVIGKKLRLKTFGYEILRQSLDARNKPNVYWRLHLRIFSKELKGANFSAKPGLIIPYQKRKTRVVVAGSGPAGFFSAYVLQKAGYRVTILEKGPDAGQRYNDIRQFEQGGSFMDNSNYCHGEGGAGTFSDGKLTTRTKGIAPEKQFVFETYVNAGAPEEIKYFAKPHIGSDKLRIVIPKLREEFKNLGGKIFFNTEITDLETKESRCSAVIGGNDVYPCDIFIAAPGHSSYATYRMLHRHGILFRGKPFAVGVRVEHPQELINRAQWLSPRLPGVKAAEYRLTFTASNDLPVYSFCMCPGGKVVPSAPVHRHSIVNGVSDYARNSPFANAAIVVGVNLEQLLREKAGFEESLQWVEETERKIFHLTESYRIPANKINDFLHQRISQQIPGNSYPLGTFPYDFEELLPPELIRSLREGLQNFSQKIKGFESGVMLGLETKTSAPVQAVRDEHRRCEGFGNIFIVGEGSGYAGGITSSAVDGVKAAMDIIKADLH